MHVNTTKSASEIRHVYLKGAKQLRPEWGIPDEEVARITGEAATSASEEEVANVPVTNTAV